MSFFEKLFKTYDLFHSWWFIMLVILFSTNLILCIIHNFIPHLKKYFSKELFNEKAVSSPWISGTVAAAPGEGIDPALDKVKLFYKRRGFNLHETDRGTVAEKGRYARLLPFMFHLSMLIIIIGSLIGSIFGFVGTLNVHVENETDQFYNWTELKDDKLDFLFRVDRFDLEYYSIPVTVAITDTREPGKVDHYDVMEGEKFAIKGSPFQVQIINATLDPRVSDKSFSFNLFKDNKLIGKFYDNQQVDGFPYLLYYPIQVKFRMIPVNDPGGATTYSTYQKSIGESFEIEGTRYKVHILAFGQLEGSDLKSFYYTLYNDGAKVGEYYTDREVPGFPYIIMLTAYKYPELPERTPKRMLASVQIKKDGAVAAQQDVEVNHPLTYDDITFFETSFARDQFGFMYLGFQIVKDPGIWVVYSGFILMFIAIIPIFIVSHKKVYITNDENNIYLSGEATKNKSGFRDEFNLYLKELNDDED